MSDVFATLNEPVEGFHCTDGRFFVIRKSPEDYGYVEFSILYGPTLVYADAVRGDPTFGIAAPAGDLPESLSRQWTFGFNSHTAYIAGQTGEELSQASVAYPSTLAPSVHDGRVNVDELLTLADEFRPNVKRTLRELATSRGAESSAASFAVLGDPYLRRFFFTAPATKRFTYTVEGSGLAMLDPGIELVDTSEGRQVSVFARLPDTAKRGGDGQLTPASQSILLSDGREIPA